MIEQFQKNNFARKVDITAFAAERSLEEGLSLASSDFWFLITLGSLGFMKPGDKPIHTEEVSLISSMEICSPGRFSFKMSEP